MVTYKLKRIKDLAIEKGLSIAKIGRDCGFPNNSTLHMMIARNSGDLTKVFKVASYLNVDIGELVEGLDISTSETLRQRALAQASDTIKTMSENLRSTGMVSDIDPEGLLPLITFDLLSGKSLKEVIEDESRLRKYLIPQVAGGDFLIIMPGQVMSPELQSGDILVCKYIGVPDTIEYGQKFIVEYSDGYVIRTVEPSENGRVKLTSPNPLYQPALMPVSKIESLSVIKGVIRGL